MAEKNDAPRGISRRHLLIGGAVAGAGAVTAVGADALLSRPHSASAPKTPVPWQTESFWGAHQAGVQLVPQSHQDLVALDLKPGVDRAALARWFRILTDDISRLMSAEPPLADTEPELAEVEARLTVTLCVGPGFVRAAGISAPAWLQPLPSFRIDQLDDAWSGGDVALQIAADDAVAVAHARRMLLKDSREFATLRWSQRGFRRARGAEAEDVTMRNLFGQVDGTVNPKPSSIDFDREVWMTGGAWAGGTSLVVRRIRMNLDKWDELDRDGREQAIGRRLSNGSPLTGRLEHDEPDFSAVSSAGFPVIPEFSHMARARGGQHAKETIFRRSYNYDESAMAGSVGGSGSDADARSVSDSGLIFTSFQADVTKQYVPIQQRLADVDILNEWTTPIGSAVFAVPPGCERGSFLGAPLLA